MAKDRLRPAGEPFGIPIDSLGMRSRSIFVPVCAAIIALLIPALAVSAQEPPARRVANVVGVAMDEYAKAVDQTGRLVSTAEHAEAIDFLADAAGAAAKLPGVDGAAARALLDTLQRLVSARRPPSELHAVYERFTAALGEAGSLELPTRAVDVLAGRRIYAANCASCHGDLGRGDGPAAAAMTPAPPAIGTREAMSDVSPAAAFRVISVGVTGTPMPAWASRLSADQRWDVVAYIGTLRTASDHRTSDSSGAAALTRAGLPPATGTFAWQADRSDDALAAELRAHGVSRAELQPALNALRSAGLADTNPRGAASATGPAGAAARVVALLNEALAMARAGDAVGSGDRAFDAYIAFEPLETSARLRNPGAVVAMESRFAEFKGAVRAGDMAAASSARDAVISGLPEILALAQPSAPSRWSAFFESFLIVLREGFEAILVVGAVVAVLVKTGNRERLREIWIGVALAVVASGATAYLLATVLRRLPASREVLEGITMLVAVLVLFSVSYWLISKVEAARWQAFIREKVTAALTHGRGRALAVVAFLAVYREGAETALFYQALFQQYESAHGAVALGVVAGAAALSVIFVLFYRFGVRIPMRTFFGVTSALLYYMAFVFAGKGVRELQEGNALSMTLLHWAPSAPALGVFPTVETIGAQLVLLALLAFALIRTFAYRRPPVAAGVGLPG